MVFVKKLSLQTCKNKGQFGKRLSPLFPATQLTWFSSFLFLKVFWLWTNGPERIVCLYNRYFVWQKSPVCEKLLVWLGSKAAVETRIRGFLVLKSGFLDYYEPFPKQALVFTRLQYKPFENTVGKAEIALNEQFLLFPQCFLLCYWTFLPFSSNLKLLSATFLNLEEAKICCVGNS